jgi:hypothetical protein
MDIEPELVARGEMDEAELEDDYTSRHPAVSLVQSALDHVDDVAPLAAAAETEHFSFLDDYLHYLLKSKHKFVDAQGPNDFRFALPAQCRVALVGDWGTGTEEQENVARSIAATDPQHIIHLGDIYPTGAPREVEVYFKRVWDRHKPAGAKLWAMNGNHEMYAKGYGYFDEVLPYCDQPASYFRLENDHWRLLCLDSAYDEYTLHGGQWNWLVNLLVPEHPKNIVLTHHQVFSAIDNRPEDHHTDVGLGPVAAAGGVYGWLWGHEHICSIYDRAPEYGNMRARCIGHGGKAIKLPYPTKPRHPAPPLQRTWDVARGDGTALNGFALLTFDGPRLHIAYMDENGGTWFEEDWNADE